MKKHTLSLWTMVAAMAAVGLLWKTAEVSAGVTAGLRCCAAMIIPSLFPFMILASLIASTRLSGIISRWVEWITRPLGLPSCFGTAFLMSFLGGFPVGARILSEQLSKGELDAKSTGLALCFCVNAGPSFLISAVGAGMFGSRSAGVFLLAAQVISALLICALVCRVGKLQNIASSKVKPLSGGFVCAVQNASAGILSICAFVVAFSALSAFLHAIGIFDLIAGSLGNLFPRLGVSFFSAALVGILEVSAGCAAASALPGRIGFTLCAFLVSFASLSILFQVRACFAQDSRVDFGPFYRTRLLHGLLTAMLAWWLWQFLPPDALSAAAISSRPIPCATPNMAISTICLICMCSILLLPRRLKLQA